MSRFAAVAVQDGGEHVAAIVRSLECGLRDAWKLLADGVGVRGRRRTERVKPDLLIEVNVRLGAFARLRIARVPESGTVAVPRHSAAAGRIVDVFDDVAERAAAVDVEYVDRTIFAAIFRERDRDALAVERWDVEVGRRRAARIGCGRIEDDTFRLPVVRIVEDDQ